MLRKKRSNSDSELTLLDSYNRQQERKLLGFHYDMQHLSQSVTDDDINFSFLPDSPTDHHVFDDDFAMDPSEMFVSPTNSPQSIFPCSPSIDRVTTETESIFPCSPSIDRVTTETESIFPCSPSIDRVTTETESIFPCSPSIDRVTTETANSICDEPMILDPPNVQETPAVIPAQLLVFDLGLSSNAHTVFVSDDCSKDVGYHDDCSKDLRYDDCNKDIGYHDECNKDIGYHDDCNKDIGYHDDCNGIIYHEEKPRKKNNTIFPKKKTKQEKEAENEINKQWVTDKTDLKKKGCKWKTGLWSSEEEELLRNNINDYCVKMGVPDPINMIYFTSKEDRKDFYRSISTGINRPLFCIYRKVLRIYDSKNYVGKYTHDEVEKLEKLNEICPNDWKTIGLMLGRSASSVKDRARLIKPENKRGQWDDDELQVLSKAIHEVTRTSVGDYVPDNINWKQVADKVTRRTAKQCRKKWLTHLKWKESGGKVWVKYDEVLLINRIIKLELEDESQINWNELANGWDSVRSPQWLREKWWQIKKTAPNSHSKFPELLEYLQNVYIPGIIEKVGEDITAKLDYSFPLTEDEIQVVTDVGSGQQISGSSRKRRMSPINAFPSIRSLVRSFVS